MPHFLPTQRGDVNWLPVRGKGLYGRTLRLDDTVLASASVFPMFRRTGQVEQLLVVADGSPVSVLPWAPNLVLVPVFGTIRVKVPGRALRPLSPEIVPRMAALWHFDPRWVLRDSGRLGGAAAQALARTNCAERLRRNVKSILFRRDLSRIVVVVTAKDGNYQFSRWRAEDLPAAQQPAGEPVVSTARPEWVLAPIWMASGVGNARLR